MPPVIDDLNPPSPSIVHRPEIKATISPKIGFASHQNAVPVLRELTLVHPGAEPLTDLVLELSSDPEFLEPKVWRIDALREAAVLHVSDRDVKLNAGFLADLTEGLTGEVRLRLLKDEVELAATRCPVEILARNHWGGGRWMPELLPAFSLPNDPAIDRILKGASDVLRRAGKPAGIDGYESKSRTRTWELASAIWSSVAGLGLSYALPPASFEQAGQKVRTPGAILDGRVGTCLDTTLLFTAALEQAQLNPLIILTQGHAFAGIWLQPQEFSQLITEEAAAVRKRIELQELIVFETTLITQVPVPGFSAAVEYGKRHLTDEEFQMVIDLRRARMQRIRPLALATTNAAATGEIAAPPVSEVLDEAPALPSFDVETAPDTNTPAGKLAAWQRKLLDLTTRNRLLHIPEGSKGVPLVCHDPGILEDRLAEGRKIRVVAVPDLEAGGRDAALYAQQQKENLQEEYAKDAFARGEVLSPLTKAKLESELIDLYRKSRSDLDEGGANTLFLALGFLRWRKSADDSRTYRAPLILLPVKLERKSALSGVTMVAHEDEPRFNLTLLELLRQDFELTIPGLDGALPMDDSGVDVARVWNVVRQAVRDIPGFEVSGEILLGTFSFAKYLMWKDLADRKEQLTRSPVVRHLIEGGGTSFPGNGAFSRPEDLDRTIDPSKWFAPLPADSSQLAAVAASANGCDFVLDGPPGTGKSQTIANMIAHNLALGRRVLFVAEKMAALEVVYRRLEEKGLGEFCLEVHSNKTSKVEVLKQLERAWDTRDSLSAEEWAREAGEIRRLRDRLNEVVGLLHQRHPNGWTLHRAIGLVVRDASEATPKFNWPQGTRHDETHLATMRDTARRLDLNLRALTGVPRGFTHIQRAEWSNGWQESVVACAAELPLRLDQLIAARDTLLASTRLPLTAASGEEMSRLITFVRTLMTTHGSDLSFAFAPDVNDQIAAARRVMELLAAYRATEKKLSAPYPATGIRSVDVARVGQEWAAAEGKFAFFATLAKKKVTASLAATGGVIGLPDVPRDLPLLAELQELLQQLEKTGPAIARIPGWAGIDSDVAKLTSAIELADRIRGAIPGVATSPEHLVELRATVRSLVVDANELLGANGMIAVAAGRLEQELPLFRDVDHRLLELCSIPSGTTLDFTQWRETALAIQQQQLRLKEWCDWRRVRGEAIALGLQSLVQAIEAGALAAGQTAGAFETAYARWFAAGEIDADSRLRNFVSAEHMSDIESYRRMDDRMSQLTVRYIRSKLCGQIPSKNDVSKRDGFGILKYELQKQRRHKPLRQLALEMGDAMTRLAPCMLMSPLSIAQYLPAEQELFDLVIFDEASQIAPWDAIGSIARGKQVVIAGDPRQMPPTSFFNRAASADEDVEEDMESILDECLAAGVPRHSLSWHYRSRHESLIAFSNHRYYDGNLVTFPAAVTRDSAVSWRKVAGVYAKGSGRTNQAEAEAMVAETLQRLTDPSFIAARKSIAIVTLNSEQQKLVEDLLDRTRRQHPEIERFFSEEAHEPVVVKNLETVQGDERDLVMLGIGYGPTEPGANAMSMSFGPLNRDGGWRRLNVAVTRARQEMVVFTSFDSTMIDLNRTSARAVRDLKHFIEFAERGPRALAEAVSGSVGGHDSPFEEAVARGLRERGWEVIPQIGVSRFRIDLGIVHPDRPGDYLVGIECDGASYHSAATARDRDKVRAAVLEGLGWQLRRVWSTDWWVDQPGALERLHESINAVLSADREKVARLEAEKTAAAALAAAAIPVHPAAATVMEEVVFASAALEATFVAAAGLPVEVIAGTYRITDFSGISAIVSPDHFHEPGYDQVLQDLIRHVLTCEAPLSEATLVQRIARVHGFQKAGRLIRERVLECVERDHHLRVDPVGGSFVWQDTEAPVRWCSYRLPVEGEIGRSIDEIPFEELRAAALVSAGLDRPVEIARLFGIRRLTATTRERLEAVISLSGIGAPQVAEG